MRKILVCGEALIDMFAGPAEGPRMKAELVAGGSPYNVAIGLARLGADAAFFGGVSTDRFGEVLRETLIREGVDTSLVRSRANPTTLGVVASGADGQPRYSFYGADAADRALAPADLPDDLDGFQAIVMGSYTLAVPPVAEALSMLAEREGSRLVLSLDPNLRPTVIGDLAGWPAQFERFARRATIVKASDEDIATAFGGRVSVGDAARHWLGLGPALVAITRGAEGAVAFTAAGEWEVPGRRTEVIDTVGAGDSFHAAMLAELDRRGLLSRSALASATEGALRPVLGYAAAAASVTCARRGADLPTAADVAAALDDR
jgi:fructokinase